MHEIAVRSAEASDMDRLVALAEDCPGAPRWTLTTWRQVLDSAVGGQQRSVLVAESEGRLIAFGVVGIGGDEAEIESLAVKSDVRRKGIGRSLCESLMHWARERRASKVLLEARMSNDAARSLYQSLGFREIAARKSYYREPEEDGVVMAREL